MRVRSFCSPWTPRRAMSGEHSAPRANFLSPMPSPTNAGLSSSIHRPEPRLPCPGGHHRLALRASPRIQVPGAFLPMFQGHDRINSRNTAPGSGCLQHCFCFCRSITQQERSSTNPYIRARMLEQNGERITSGITLQPQLLERRYITTSVLVSRLCVSSPYRFRLRDHVLRKFLHNPFQILRHHHSPALIFSMTSSANERCFS